MFKMFVVYYSLLLSLILIVFEKDLFTFTWSLYLLEQSKCYLKTNIMKSMSLISLSLLFSSADCEMYNPSSPSFSISFSSSTSFCSHFLIGLFLLLLTPLHFPALLFSRPQKFLLVTTLFITQGSILVQHPIFDSTPRDYSTLLIV